MKRKLTLLLITLVLAIVYSNLNAQCIGDTFSKYNVLNGSIDAMDVSSNGYVVTAHMNALTIYDGIAWTKYSVSNLAEVSDVAIDNNKKVYVSQSWTGFLVWENATTYTFYDTNDGLHSLEMQGLKVAPDGKVWIGSFGDGCSYFDGTGFTEFNTSNGLPDNYIVGFDFDDKGNVYMASYNGSVIIYDGATFTNLIPPTVNEVNGIALDGKGGFWITAYSGASGNVLVHYDGSKWETINYPTMMYPSYIESDMSGNVLLGSWNGFYKYDGLRWKSYTTTEGLYDNQVTGLGVNNFDEVWVSGSDGLSKLGEYSEVKGNVKAGTNGVWEGFAKLYKKTNGVKKYVQYDSVQLSSGGYVFSNVPVGEYLILAVGDPNTAYAGYAGTYLGNVELWSSADVVNVAFCDTTYSNKDINLIEKVIDPPGKGYISGHIKSADGTRAGSEPIKDVDVTLRKVPGGVVKQTKTNDFGFYEFDAIANGIYGIIIDLPGLSLDSVRTVEITNTDTTFADQDYEVDSSGIHVGDFSSINDNQIISNSFVYPNPTSGQLNIHFSNSNEERIYIELLNVNGTVIYKNQITDKGEINEQIEMSAYAPGIYLLKLQGGNSMKMIKVILN